MFFITFFAHGQALNATFLEYIERYKHVALEHQREYGVPASITLAQGLLESNAGRSYLARRGNNHFGIKCYSWKGPVVEYDDTLKHNCYRNYGSPEDSFLDHAKFLRGKRYSALYELEVTDYQGWAQGLRDCGYAEDPAYPQKLITLIEQYGLNDLEGSESMIAKGVASSDNADDKNATVPPPPAKKRKKAVVPPPKKHTVAEKQEIPSRAGIDRRVERQSAGKRTRATATGYASADND